MAARPPPARPHISKVNPSHLSYSIAEWGEDDAWDSGSDSESPAATAWRLPSPAHPNPSAPKPVPSRTKNAHTTSDSGTSSSLAFSYTDVSVPSPSSYPSPPAAPELENTPRQNRGSDWTLLVKAHDGTSAVRRAEASARAGDAEGVDEEMVLGELEPDALEGDGDGDFIDMPIVKSHADLGTVKADAEAIMDDPLRLACPPALIPPDDTRSDVLESNEKLRRERSIKTNRKNKFVECLGKHAVDMAELRKLAWSGIPNHLRPIAWQMLLGYLSLHAPVRQTTLQRKRQEYASLVELTFARGRDGLDQQIWHQIEIDVPRTRPGVPLWMCATTQRCLERILYVWAIRHPASGYVQGINDLATPFFQVFLSAYLESDPEDADPSVLPPAVLQAVEADTFWCLTRLLDGIQDNYITAQPGIQRSVRRMAELVARIDVPLFEHLHAQGVEFMQFAFRWMNCLLMREISVKNTIRMWDTYLAEGTDAFSQFHLYVCSAFLVRWSDKLRKMDFQGIIMFLQSLPTQDWTDHEIEMLLSQAFVLNSTWANAQSHFAVK
ncbi:rab-GTPase-TBC domain-containing protein [Vararia minispora EC-137]|uniref:Rab-GTPase-TBC domain-containing protein n=1 Tax=Vararia minispora EC-137 TaxID=1314806 RepID=A0ACB8QEE6_9AGAM|nr:rab-GTPase-TBC domain-containing protein [Vararia minispora EC-137]